MIADKRGQEETSGASRKTNGLDAADQTSLFDGKELGHWKKSDFYQAGRVFIKDGCLVLERSEWMTGVTWSGPLLRINYEIRFEAMRVEGNDFFCGLTFPVGKSSCTLILGGWHNRVSGLSTLDHKDASLNETTLETALENNRWYKVVLRVTPDKIQAALDGEWIDVYKDPVTDKGKQSKRGRMTLLRHREYGGFRTVPVPASAASLDDVERPAGYDDAMVTVWEDGRLLRDWTFAEIRARADAARL